MDSTQPSTSKLDEQTDWTHWSISVLCQKNTSEMLWCPAKSKGNTHGAGYKTIANLLEGFNVAGCLPRTINLSRFNDGEGMKATLRKHKTKWYGACRL